MHFSTSVHYDASADRVVQLWHDPEFHRAKAKQAGATSTEVSIRDEAQLTITIRAAIPAAILPSAARKFVGNVLQLTTVEVWDAADDGGVRNGTLSLDIAGAPVQVSAQMRLLPREKSCQRTLDGEVSARIPLFARAIEKAAVGAVDDVVAAEAKIAADFLTREQ